MEEFKIAARTVLSQTLSAAMFLSRLPLHPVAARIADDQGEMDFEQTTRYFGLAAIIVSAPTAVVLWVSAFIGFPASISVILAVATLVLATGALHEDGLADVADGFGGGKTVKDKLAIMRDSQIGTYGAASLILGFLLQISSLIQLMAFLGPLNLGLIMIAANVAATTVMVWPWATMPAARKEGGLSVSLGIPTISSAKTSVLIGFSVAFILLFVATGFIAALSALAACWISMLAFNAFCRSQIGGHTGDTLGASKKISELGLLLALIIAT